MTLMTKTIWVRIWIGCLVILLASCASSPEPKAISAAKPRIASPVVSYALSLQGAPYRFGKESPEDGFDCSGFVRHVYRRQGVMLPRTTRDMANILPSIPTHSVRSGDLVFFNINGKVFSHVGIYLDGDRFIHAPSQRSGKVMVSNLKTDYWQKRFMGVRRPSLRRVGR